MVSLRMMTSFFGIAFRHCPPISVLLQLASPDDVEAVHRTLCPLAFTVPQLVSRVPFSRVISTLLPACACL